MKRTSERNYVVRSDGVDAGRIVVAKDGKVTTDLRPPHDATVAAVLADIRAHGVTDMGQAVLATPMSVGEESLFPALWKRLSALGYVLELQD
jgi:hypothetical protein